MNKLLLLLVVLMVGCTKQYTTIYPQIKTNELRRMAILPFVDNINRNGYDGYAVARGIEAELVRHVPQLEVIDRQCVKDIVNEWNLANKNIVDTNTASTTLLKGVRYFMDGFIKYLSIEAKANGYAVAISVSVKIVDVGKGINIWEKSFKEYHFVDTRNREEAKSETIDLLCSKIVKEFYSYEKEL